MAQVQIDPSIYATAANKTVLITGAAQGIGAATAELFNKHGANVVIADLPRFHDAAEKVIKTRFENPDKGLFVPVNIVDWAQLQAGFKQAVKKFGGIDIVVANAGILETKSALGLDDVDENGDLQENAEAARVIDVNLKGTFNTLRLALFFLKKSSSTTPETTKSILLIGSTSCYFGGTGVTAYVASKHGVLGLLRASLTTAQEHGVRVNAIAPFMTPTQITVGFSKQWAEAGLEANTPQIVANAIAGVSLDEKRHGHTLLVAGKYLRELEERRKELLPTWLGDDVAAFMGKAMQFFIDIGGYVLPTVKLMD